MISVSDAISRSSVTVTSFVFSSGDANGLDEPEFIRKFQTSSHFNAQNSNLDADRTSFGVRSRKIISIYLDTILRKEHSISRTMGDDPFALDGFGDCT